MGTDPLPMETAGVGQDGTDRVGHVGTGNYIHSLNHTSVGAEAPPAEAKKAENKKRAPRKYAFTFNAETGLFEGITDAQVDEWQKTYTALDIEQELEHMADWLKANGIKKNYPRFVVGWLIRGQNGARRAV